MNIVLIVGSYYPKYSAVGKCMGNIADDICRTHNVTVLAEQNVYNQSASDMYNGHKILRVSTKRATSDLNNQFLKSKNERPGFLYDVIREKNRVFGVLKRLLSYKTIDGELERKYIEALNSIDEKIDIIIPACRPFESITAALEYKKKHLDTEIIPFVFDLFANNINLNINSVNLKIKRKANTALEREMFIHSKAVLCVDNWTKYIHTQFADFEPKAFRVEHPLLLDKRRSIPNRDGSNIHIFHSEPIKNITQIHTGILEIIHGIPDNHLVFDFFGNGDISALLDKYNQRNNISYSQDLSLSDIDTLQNNADCILLAGNKHDEYQKRLNRVLTAVLSGKPIIYLKSDPSDPVLALLDRYPNKIVVDSSEADACDAIKTFIVDNYQRKLAFNDIYHMLLNDDPAVLDSFIQYANDNHRDFNIIFAGALHTGYVEPNYILKALSEPMLARVNAVFYSSGSGVKALDTCGLNNVRHFEWVSRDELENIYYNADALLSISEKSGTQISSKIFDYMSFDKPIIHIYFHDDDVNLKYLRHYNNCLCLKGESVREIDLKILLIFLLTKDSRQSWPIHEKVLLECTPGYICSLIESIIQA